MALTYIHYSADSDYQSFSNSQRKSLEVALRNMDLCELTGDFEGSKLTCKAVKLCFDLDSFCGDVNLDCSHCEEPKCDSLYPLEILVGMRGDFEAERIIAFVTCEDTRLISLYGKHGHLRHCIDDGLLENPYYRTHRIAVDKNECFKHEDYVPAYVGLKSKLIKLFGEKVYSELCMAIKDYQREEPCLFHLR